MSKNHHCKDKLVFFNPAIFPNWPVWLGNLQKYPDWIIPGLNMERAFQKWQEYKDVLDRAGRIGRCVADRYNKEQFFYQMDSSWLPSVEYKYHDDVPNFYDVMIDSAKWVAKNGNTIDFMWSGGVDSTAALLALNEVCPKQIRVVMNENSKLEHPKLWKDLVQHLDHIVDTNDDILSVSQPDINTWVNCSEGDTLFGCAASVGTTGKMVDNPREQWKEKFRYATPIRAIRFLTGFKGDWLDVNNFKPFYVSAPIQKYACNLHIKDELVWYTNNEIGDKYKECKMHSRDFIAQVSGDRDFAYNKLKMNSFSGTWAHAAFGGKLTGQWHYRIMEQAREKIKAGAYKEKKTPLPYVLNDLVPGLGFKSLWPVHAIGADGTVYNAKNTPTVDCPLQPEFKGRYIDQEYMTFLNPEMFDY